MTLNLALTEAITLVSSLGFTPFVEIIGAVPTGLALHMEPLEAAGWSVLGNNGLIIVLLFLLKPLEKQAWFRTWRRQITIPTPMQRVLERFGAPAIVILGPTMGMFFIVPIARGLGIPTVRVALAAMVGNALFAMMYALLLSLGVSALRFVR